MPTPRLDDLRRHAVARSLFAPTSLGEAVQRLGGFVQADPLRAPARAQDLTLRHRVRDYRVGDLERRYPRSGLQEDFFINYGFVSPELRALMHPRRARRVWDATRQRQAREVLAVVADLGEAHPADVDAALGHGKVKNWFGGDSRLSTELLDGLHYRGHLNVLRRDKGTRVYGLAAPWAPPADPQAAMDAMADVLVQKYAPLPAASLSQLVSMLYAAAYQWVDLRKPTLARAKARLAHAKVDGTDWFWPADEDPTRGWRIPARVRLLAPFDPVVWDRRRFELLWGWAYRFEAYTPAAQRVRGHYALPLLWRDAVIGWGNLKWRDGRLDADLGYVAGRPPSDPAFATALDDELTRFQAFMDA
ncbi:DNA glycosylase AlkZ-like family protein [Inhella crocodyli]|uniref:Winged helix-turn-helix domain-containing protein n=1 Tax=Inhella crocodyli TaxID=2499851 RepID=A0A3S2UI94_9BURK|nr:crosslink repair DNA glycosylase YcaQ family protein [Inhella crocodyli]RVT88765.1 winged helix-turn-helix domain-containing protein [Inhella crocodyli]